MELLCQSIIDDLNISNTDIQHRYEYLSTIFKKELTNATSEEEFMSAIILYKYTRDKINPDKKELNKFLFEELVVRHFKGNNRFKISTVAAKALIETELTEDYAVDIGLRILDRETILVTFKIDPVYISMQNKKYYKDKYNINIE